MGYEAIVAGPVYLYRGAVGLAQPNLNSTPASGWSLIGEGAWDEEGILATFNQAFEVKRTNNETLPIAAFRLTEDILLSGSMMNMALESVAHAINNNDVSVTAKTSSADGYKSMSLRRGLQVEEMALLLRGNYSAYDANPGVNKWNTQLYIPRCYESGSTSFANSKVGGMLPLEFTALAHASKDPEMRIANAEAG